MRASSFSPNEHRRENPRGIDESRVPISTAQTPTDRTKKNHHRKMEWPVFNKIVQLNNLTYCSSHQKGAKKRKEPDQLRKLVLVLGGILHTDRPDASLRLIYKRLEERPTEALVDVVVVDPDKWQSVPIGRVDHQQMDLEAYFTQERLNELLVKYEAIAVIDDIFFREYAKREAITQGRAWRALASLADNHPDVFTWWILKHHEYNSTRTPELVKMNNYTRTLLSGTQQLLPLVPSDTDKFSTIWNPILQGKVDLFRIQHPFRELLRFVFVPQVSRESKAIRYDTDEKQ